MGRVCIGRREGAWHSRQHGLSVNSSAGSLVCGSLRVDPAEDLSYGSPGW